MGSARSARWLLIASVVFACPSTSWSQPPTEPTELNQTLASPRRIPGRFVDAARYPGNATVLTAEDLKASGASTVQEALARAEGVILFDQQGFGLASDSSLNLRGIVNGARTNVLVLVDGVRQNRLTGDEVHWQSLPLNLIDRIEILRGGGGLSYGEGALGGVINIITTRAGERPLQTEHRVEIGSFGWQQYATAARGRVAPVTYATSLSRRFVDGYRESSSSRNTTVDNHVGVELGRWVSASVSVLHSQDTTAFPGGLTRAQAEARPRQAGAFHGFNENELDQTVFDLVGGPWEGLSGVLTAFSKRQTQSSEDNVRSNSFTVTPSQGLSLRGNHEWRGGGVDTLLVSGVELSDDKATTGVGRNPSFAQPDSESNRRGYGLFTEETVTFWNRLSFVGGLRYDRFRYEEAIVNPAFIGSLRFQGFSPKVGVTYQLLPEQLGVFAAYSRPFKAPNVDDFSAQVPSFLNTTFSGNVNLHPQQADTYEIGTRLTAYGVRANATWFHTRIHDEILTEPTTLQNQNFNTQRIGTELSVQTTVPAWLRTRASYAFTDATFRSGRYEGNRIPATPEHLVTAGLGVSPLPALWIDLDWRIVQGFPRINDFANTLPADNYNVLDLMIRYDFSTWAHHWGGSSGTAYVKVENLTNQSYSAFQSSNGVNLNGAGEYPAPPIGVVGGVTLSF